MVDEIAQQIEVQKGKRKTKTVNQDVVKEIGPMSYPGRSHGQGILVNFKISDSTLVAKKVNHEKSDEVIVGSNTEGPKRL